MRLCELQSRSGLFREEIDVFPLPEIEPWIVQCVS